MTAGRTRHFDDLDIDEDILYAAMEEARRMPEPRTPSRSASTPHRRNNAARARRNSTTLTGGTFLMALFAFAALISAHGSTRLILACLAVLGILLGFVLLLGGGQTRQNRCAIRAALNRRGFHLCIECGYSLEGLPADSAKCPECGAHHAPVNASVKPSPLEATERQPP